MKYFPGIDSALKAAGWFFSSRLTLSLKPQLPRKGNYLMSLLSHKMIENLSRIKL